VEGNAFGTYLTLASMGALIFGIINIVGNFGTVFVDQSYWQRAIASRPKAATGGFILGGLAWFAIPFTLATTLGLAAVATGVTLTENEIELGLVAPTAAANLMGDVGAILILTIIFTAVTAAGSSQLVSVSSLVTYDVFRTYVKPSSSGRELMRISRFAILGFGMGMGILASILFHSGFSLQYVYLMMGVLIGSAVAPISFALLWKKTNRYAATSGAILGLACGVASWLASAEFMSGEITLSSTGNLMSLLIGNVTSIAVSLGITVIGSMIKSERFDFGIMRQKIMVVDDKVRSMLRHDTDEEFLKRSLKFCKRIGLSVSVFLVVVWPASFYLTEFVFVEQTFHLWIWLAIIWASGAAGIIIFLPLIEARKNISEILNRAKMNSEIMASPEYSYPSDEQPLMKILVPVDGSAKSLNALYHASYIFRGAAKVRIYLLHVIEWPDENEGNMDEELATQIQDEGRLILRSIVVPKQINDYKRIVKLGDPSEKIAEVADKLKVDMIIMGKKGIGKSGTDLGHVTSKVLTLTSKPVALID
jgi:nucleotide-binding universal stress UspA family protein